MILRRLRRSWDRITGKDTEFWKITERAGKNTIIDFRKAAIDDEKGCEPVG